MNLETGVEEILVVLERVVELSAVRAMLAQPEKDLFTLGIFGRIVLVGNGSDRSFGHAKKRILRENSGLERVCLV